MIARVRRWVPGAAIGLFAVLAATQAGAPLHLDNMDFPAAAHAVAETGEAHYYRGEDNPRHSFLYHPPLYIYTLALWFRLVGPGPAQARIFGALCALLLCWVAVACSRRLLGPRSRDVDWALWPIFLLQAYTLQSSAILDIDTSIYGPLLVGLIAVTVSVGRAPDGWPRRAEVAAIVLLLALSLWAKLTTVAAVVAVLPLLLWPRLRLWRSLAVTAAIGGASVMLFLVTYFAYGRGVGANVGYSFRFLIESFFRGGVAPSYVANATAMIPFTVRWTGLLPWAVAILLAFTPAFARHFELRGGALLQFRAVLALALGVTLYYLAQTRSFGAAPYKYVFVFWPLVLLPFALLSGDAVVAVARAGWRLAARVGAAGGVLAILLAGLVVGRYVLGDALLPYGAVVTLLPGLVLAGPAVLAVLAALAWHLGGAPRSVSAIAWLVAAAMHVGVQAGVATYQTQASHSTSYDYGQQGIAETIAYVSSHTAPNALISSMKDVGYQAKRRYLENYLALYGDEAAARRLIQMWESGSVALIVFTEGVGQDQVFLKPILARWLAEHAELVARYGHYRIYRPSAARGSAPPSG